MKLNRLSSFLKAGQHFGSQVPDFVLVHWLEPVRIIFLLIGFVAATVVLLLSLFVHPSQVAVGPKQLEKLDVNAINQVNSAMQSRALNHSQRLRFSPSALYHFTPPPLP